MTYYLKQGNSFKPRDESELDIHDLLPVGNYIINQDAFGNMYFEQVDSFEINFKMYGDTVAKTDRILNTFDSRPGTTGVMLTGEKGSGKSLLAKNISIEAAAKGIPTLIINHPWHGDQFNKFIQSIQQPCVILFDEFEKVYSSNEQEAILTLLDGVFPTKKLFVLTCNDRWRVDNHLRNRPGRIYYMINYAGLDIDFVREYATDNLKDQSHVDQVANVTAMFTHFNFDMLKALIEEMNRYGECPQDALAMLNVKPEYEDAGMLFEVGLKTIDGDVPSDFLEDRYWNGNPITAENFYMYYRAEDGVDYGCNFSRGDLKTVDVKAGKYVFINSDDDQLTLTRHVRQNFNYFNLF